MPNRISRCENESNVFRSLALCDGFLWWSYRITLNLKSVRDIVDSLVVVKYNKEESQETVKVNEYVASWRHGGMDRVKTFFSIEVW